MNGKDKIFARDKIFDRGVECLTKIDPTVPSPSQKNINKNKSLAAHKTRRGFPLLLLQTHGFHRQAVRVRVHL